MIPQIKSFFKRITWQKQVAASSTRHNTVDAMQRKKRETDEKSKRRIKSGGVVPTPCAHQFLSKVSVEIMKNMYDLGLSNREILLRGAYRNN